MSIFKTKTIPRRYQFPNVCITGTQICCGLRPVYIDQAVVADSTYDSRKKVLFGMMYFSKFQNLHQHNERDPPPGFAHTAARFIDVTKLADNSLEAAEHKMFFNHNPVNWRHWILDMTYGYLFTHYVQTCDELIDYISKQDLGTTVVTPEWKNKRSAMTLKTFIWHWNGRVPTPESAGITDFPYTMQGTLKEGLSSIIKEETPVSTHPETVVAA